jgi:hypothetical protein
MEQPDDMKPFDLDIQSVIPLPGCVATGAQPDVTIQYGEVPLSLPNPAMIRACTQARPGQFLLTLDHVAKYLVEDGNCITIEPAPGVTDDEVRLFLMSAVWSALLLQRGLLPIHGSALRVKEGAIILAGPTGNGKSTLAAALMGQGYPLIADELCALAVREDSPPLLLPGFPQLLLWEDSLRRLTKDILQLVPVRPGLKKYTLPLENCMPQGSLPLERLYILAVGNKPSLNISPFQGMKKIHALIDCTYRVHHVAGHGLSAAHFKQCAEAARFIDVKRIERMEILFDIDSLVKRLTEDF